MARTVVQEMYLASESPGLVGSFLNLRLLGPSTQFLIQWVWIVLLSYTLPGDGYAAGLGITTGSGVKCVSS